MGKRVLSVYHSQGGNTEAAAQAVAEGVRIVEGVEPELKKAPEADADDLIKPKAYVVLKSGQEPSEALANELKAFVKERLAPFKYPRWIEFVPELPKTATGKIQRFKLRSDSEV